MYFLLAVILFSKTDATHEATNMVPASNFPEMVNVARRYDRFLDTAVEGTVYCHSTSSYTGTLKDACMEICSRKEKDCIGFLLKDGKCCTASSLDTDGTVFSETGTIFYRMVPSEMFAYTNINTCEFVGDTCRTVYTEAPGPGPGSGSGSGQEMCPYFGPDAAAVMEHTRFVPGTEFKKTGDFNYNTLKTATASCCSDCGVGTMWVTWDGFDTLKCICYEYVGTSESSCPTTANFNDDVFATGVYTWMCMGSGSGSGTGSGSGNEPSGSGPYESGSGTGSGSGKGGEPSGSGPYGSGSGTGSGSGGEPSGSGPYESGSGTGSGSGGEPSGSGPYGSSTTGPEMCPYYGPDAGAVMEHTTFVPGTEFSKSGDKNYPSLNKATDLCCRDCGGNTMWVTWDGFDTLKCICYEYVGTSEMMPCPTSENFDDSVTSTGVYTWMCI